MLSKGTEPPRAILRRANPAKRLQIPSLSGCSWVAVHPRRTPTAAFRCESPPPPQVGQRLGQRAVETLERSQKTTHGAGNSAALLALRQHKTLQQLRQQFAEAQAERLAPDGGPEIFL